MPDDPLNKARSESLFKRLYADLREIAERQFRNERPGHTLQPTAIVHEAYLKLVQSPPSDWESRSQVLGCAAHAMRQVLVDHARAKSARKRGGGWRAVTLDESLAVTDEPSLDVLALDQALQSLAERAGRCARVAELRLFAGLTSKEMAELLDVSTRTVDSDWAYARLWLRRALAASSRTQE